MFNFLYTSRIYSCRQFRVHLGLMVSDNQENGGQALLDGIFVIVVVIVVEVITTYYYYKYRNKFNALSWH